MIVVDERVFDAGGRERRWKLRLPDALGKPGAVRPRAKMLFHVIARAAVICSWRSSGGMAMRIGS